MSKASELSCIRRIDAQIIEKYGLSRRELVFAGRIQPHSEARQLAIWMLRRYTDLSLPQIARRYGEIHHTTVLHAEQAVQRWVGGRALMRDLVVRDFLADET